jgi:hypothetical protein
MSIAYLVDCDPTNPANGIIVGTDLAPLEMSFDKCILHCVGSFFRVATNDGE